MTGRGERGQRGLPPSPLAGEGRGEGACSHAVIPDVSNTVILDISNAVIPDVSNAVIPNVSHPVIPDVINRESKARVRGLDSRIVQQPRPAPPAQNAAVILLTTESQILRFAQNDRGGWANARGRINMHDIPGFPRAREEQGDAAKAARPWSLSLFSPPLFPRGRGPG